MWRSVRNGEVQGVVYITGEVLERSGGLEREREREKVHMAFWGIQSVMGGRRNAVRETEALERCGAHKATHGSTAAAQHK
jgi:hypothetical protein